MKTLFSAVQHERAPRSCIPGNQLSMNPLAQAHLDASPFSSRHIPLHHPHYQNRNGLILPIPIHMPSAFTSSLDPSAVRHYPQFGAFHSSMFDSLHFASSNASTLFPPPLPPPPLLSANESLSKTSTRDPPFLHPFQISMFKTLSTKPTTESTQINALQSPSMPPVPLPSSKTTTHRVDGAGKKYPIKQVI